MALISQLTNRVRLYGTECGQAEYVLRAIQDLGLEMTVTLGVWVSSRLDMSLRQLSDMRTIVRQFPHKMLDSILVGNEVLFRNELSLSELTAYVEYVRNYLESQGIYDVPVGTSDIGSKLSLDLLDKIQVFGANIHPFFGGVKVEESTKWTYDFLANQIAVEVPYSSNVSYIISEVGWPTAGGSIQGAKPGVEELQTFLDSWICQNIDSGIGWYWFEAFDQPWKKLFEEEWESNWGLFTPDRQLKDIVLPTCGNFSNSA